MNTSLQNKLNAVEKQFRQLGETLAELRKEAGAQPAPAASKTFKDRVNDRRKIK